MGVWDEPSEPDKKKKKVLPAFLYVVSYCKCKHPKGSYYLNCERKKCWDLIKHEIVVIIGCSAIPIRLKQENMLSAFKLQARTTSFL